EREYRQTAPAAESGARRAGRHHREGSARARLERDAVEPGEREGRSRRFPGSRRRTQGALLQVEQRGRGRLTRAAGSEHSEMSRLQEHYRTAVVPQLMERLGVKNPMAVPRFVKVTMNMGVCEALADRNVLEYAMSDLARITGQKAVPPKDIVSSTSFKLCVGYPYCY